MRIEDVALEGPAVHLERLASGVVPIPDFARVRPSRPPPSKGTPWNVVVDRAALHQGRFSFLDHVTTPPENAELELDNLGFRDFTLLHADDDVPGHGSIEAKFGDGTVRIDTFVHTRAEGYAFEATVDVTNLPLDRMQQHAPQLGWSGFTGRLDAHVTLRAEPNDLPASSGTVALRDLRIEVPGEAEPALAWRKLAVDVEEIGIARRRAILKTVTPRRRRGDGDPEGTGAASAAPRTREERVAAGATEAEDAAGAVASAPSPAPSPVPAEPPPPWTWKVGHGRDRRHEGDRRPRDAAARGRDRQGDGDGTRERCRPRGRASICRSRKSRGRSLSPAPSASIRSRPTSPRRSRGRARASAGGERPGPGAASDRDAARAT